MKQVAGDIEVMPIGDMVAWLANRDMTGKLTVSRANVERSFIIADAEVRQGASNDPREFLGQHLLNFGLIEEEALEKAFQTQRETTVPLGRILVMVGQVTEEQLTRALAFKVRESLLDALEWRFGTFSFVPGEHGKRELDLEVPVLLSEVHSEGQSRRMLWGEMRKNFASGDLRCVVVSRPEKCGPHEERIFRLLDDGLTINDLLLELRALEFHVYARLYDFYQRGHIRTIDEAPAPAVEEPAAASFQEAMRTALDEQDFSSAYTSAQQLLDHDAHDEEALAAIEISEEHVARAVESRAIDRTGVPLLKLDPEQSASGDYTAKERYVLSRVDGERTLNQIIQVSPIAEVEFLQIVQRFVDRGLLEFK
jgi:hypothetical protein